MPPDHVDIITVKDKDPNEVLVSFAEELAKRIIRHGCGINVLKTFTTKKERFIFMTGYHASLVDYLKARVSGTIEEPEFGTKPKC